MAEGLEIELPFPGGAEEAVPCFVQNGYSTSSATHTLVACEFGDIDQNRGSHDVISSDVVWRRLGRENVEDVLGEAGREMSGYVVNIVRVGARVLACHREAGISGRTGQV